MTPVSRPPGSAPAPLVSGEPDVHHVAGTESHRLDAERASQEPSTTTTQNAQSIEHLRELILALDRRVTHIERTGELDIARDAALLKDRALKRIAELAAAAQGKG